MITAHHRQPGSVARCDPLASLRSPAWPTLLLAVSTLTVSAGELPRWQAMDYGPYLTATIEAPEPRTNIAFKGIAINLGANFGGEHNEAVVFDTDLLRYSVGWTGKFVALKGVVYDGEHWAYPRINGRQVFGNHALPGWAKAGSFKDPREFCYGPIPHDWAHWKGLYLYEKKVVLSYTVGTTPVLDMPSLERQGQLAAFVRTLNLGPTATDNTLQVFFDAHRRAGFVGLADLKPVDREAAATTSLAVFSPNLGDPTETNVLAAAVVGGANDPRWLTTQAGELRLRLPACAGPTRCKLFIWSGPREQLAVFAALVRSSAGPDNLEAYTHGGPSRWAQKVVTHGRLGANAGPYAIDTLTEPEPNPWHSWMRFGGIDFFPDGKRAALCTWSGDVWIVSGVDGDLKNLTWQRIATGLFQPLGLQIVDGQIYVLGRDQITRLHDLNGDGETDFYENFNNDCMTSEHFHEFALDLKYGPDGNFYYIKCACHGLPAKHPHHGTLLRVSHDGAKLEVVARGFRAANGLGVGPHLEFTCIDNQGFWMPANRINWIKPGGWYGNQWAWNPAGRTNYDEPLCWMHNFVDRSGGTQLWVPTDQWGPFRNEIITISYGMGHMFLLLKEEVNDLMQGAVTRFPLEFETGVMRGVFHPQTGQLYTCGLYGWASNKTRPGGFYRVRYTGQPVHMVNELHFVRDGILLGFTDPLDPDSATDAGNYDVKAWNYLWTANYGSPDFKLNGQEGRDSWPVESATLSADHKRVFLKVPDVQRVMQLHLVFDLKAADGAEVKNFVHGTIHNLGAKPGAEWLGPGAIARAGKTEMKLPHQAPGLIQTFSRAKAQADTRLARLPALFVPAGASPTPFLGPGAFQTHWEGFLKLDLNDEMTFATDGRGKALLRINGATVLEAGGSLEGVRSQPVALRRGLNRFDLDYSSLPDGAAEFRLAWSSKRLLREPVPPTAFVHDADDPALASRALVREGRELFAEGRCVRCHLPQSALPSGAMPELAADAPGFDGIGGRLNRAWIEQWLLDPKAVRADAQMPILLSGPTATNDARDIADYLASLRSPKSAGTDSETNPASSANLATLGSKLFAELGCVACHWLPGDLVLSNEVRIPLGYVAAKWQPEALAAFLRAPGKYFHWTRMPDFKLSADEASALSAYVLKQCQSAATFEARPGDAQHGQELVASLGCLGCHTLDKAQNRSSAPAFASLAKIDWNHGCVADNVRARAKAPDFSWTSVQRSALRAFAHEGFPNSLERQDPVEFAERQYAALRCQACHPRDNQTDLLTELGAAVSKKSAGEDDDFTGGSVHVGRPLLTYAGEKLYAGWMQQFLDGSLPYKPRSELKSRMPAFAAYAAGLATGLAHEHGYPAESAPPATADAQLAEIGHRLTGVSDGFSCIACHDVGTQKALAGKDTATVNFACITQRLRPTYYWRYVQDPPHLLPGTMMPKFIGEDGTTPVKKIFNGDPQRQFTAIWNYLLSLRPGPP